MAKRTKDVSESYESKELREFRAAAAAHRKKVLSSPEAARAFLVRAGIITPKGNLRKVYR